MKSPDAKVIRLVGILQGGHRPAIIQKRQCHLIITHDRLERLVSDIFGSAGCGQAERARIAHYLVEANLVGHDSHGVIRAPTYIEWLRAGKVLANQAMKIVFENDAMAVVDGQFGFGQVMGEEAMKLGIDKAGRQGVAVVALRNSGHLGRIGDWAEMAARAGKVSLHFVNTSGGGILAAPFGGTQRRLSANPIAAGVPTQETVPSGSFLISQLVQSPRARSRSPSTRVLKSPTAASLDSAKARRLTIRKRFTPPLLAILLFGRHKGYSLSVIAEVLAGALTGGGCSHFGVDRVANNMLSIILDPAVFRSADGFTAEIDSFCHPRQELAYHRAGRRNPHAGRARGANPRSQTARGNRDRRDDLGPDPVHGSVSGSRRRGDGATMTP